MRKKILYPVLVGALVLGLVGCGKEDEKKPTMAGSNNMLGSGIEKTEAVSDKTEDVSTDKTVEATTEASKVPDYVKDYMTQYKGEIYYMVNFPDLAGTASNYTESFSYEKRQDAAMVVRKGETNYNGYLEIKNTGTAPIEVKACNVDLFGAGGKLLQAVSSDDVRILNRVVAPGELGYCYFYVNIKDEYVAEGLDNIYVTMVPSIAPYESEYTIYDDITVSDIEGDGSIVLARGEIVNTDGASRKKQKIGMIAYNAEGKIVGMISGSATLNDDGKAWRFANQYLTSDGFLPDGTIKDCKYFRFIIKDYK